MKCILIGKGKTGEVVYQTFKKEGIEIETVITSKNEDQIDTLQINDGDTIVIHFATPNCVLKHIKKVLKKHYPIVIGTTGWYSNLEVANKIAKENNGIVVYSSNFSLLVMLMHLWGKSIAKIIDKGGFSLRIMEKHHIHKKDKPSGTSITLANSIINHSATLKSWTLEEEYQNSIPIISIREGDVKGIHQITISSPYEELTINHEVKDRLVFAFGALITTKTLYKWIKTNKIKPGLHNALEILFNGEI